MIISTFLCNNLSAEVFLTEPPRCQELILGKCLYLKEVWKPEKDLEIDLNRSNPTVEVKVCLWNKIDEEYKKNNVSERIR